MHGVLKQNCKENLLFTTEELNEFGVGYFSALELSKHFDERLLLLAESQDSLDGNGNILEPWLRGNHLIDDLRDSFEVTILLFLLCAALFLFLVCILLSGTLSLCAKFIGLGSELFIFIIRVTTAYLLLSTSLNLTPELIDDLSVLGHKHVQDLVLCWASRSPLAASDRLLNYKSRVALHHLWTYCHGLTSSLRIIVYDGLSFLI